MCAKFEGQPRKYCCLRESCTPTSQSQNHEKPSRSENPILNGRTINRTAASHVIRSDPLSAVLRVGFRGAGFTQTAVEKPPIKYVENCIYLGPPTCRLHLVECSGPGTRSRSAGSCGGGPTAPARRRVASAAAARNRMELWGVERTERRFSQRPGFS